MAGRQRFSPLFIGVSSASSGRNFIRVFFVVSVPSSLGFRLQGRHHPEADDVGIEFQSPLHWGFVCKYLADLAHDGRKLVSVPSSLGFRLQVRSPSAICAMLRVSVPSSLGFRLQETPGPVAWPHAIKFQSPLHWGFVCKSIRDTFYVMAHTFQSPLHWGFVCKAGDRAARDRARWVSVPSSLGFRLQGLTKAGLR